MSSFKQRSIRPLRPLLFAGVAACVIIFSVQPEHSQTAQQNPKPTFPAVGNLSQVMRGILFPNANLIFNVQTHDPSEKKPEPAKADSTEPLNWVAWGSNLYFPWEL